MFLERGEQPLIGLGGDEQGNKDFEESAGWFRVSLGEGDFSFELFGWGFCGVDQLLAIGGVAGEAVVPKREQEVASALEVIMDGGMVHADGGGNRASVKGLQAVLGHDLKGLTQHLLASISPFHGSPEG